MNWRKPLVGPFSALQIASVMIAIAATLAILIVINQPIAASPIATIPAPGASFVPVGAPVPGLQIGNLAPDFTGTNNGQTVQLTDLNGNPIKLSDFKGQPVWISFWASWCPPCQAETPTLREVYDEHKDQGLALVAISVQESSPDDVRAYAQQYGLDYTIGFDATSAIFHTYHAYGLPTQLFLDRSGIIRDVVLGPVTKTAAEAYLAPLLGPLESPPSSTPGEPAPTD